MKILLLILTLLVIHNSTAQQFFRKLIIADSSLQCSTSCLLDNGTIVSSGYLSERNLFALDTAGVPIWCKAFQQDSIIAVRTFCLKASKSRLLVGGNCDYFNNNGGFIMKTDFYGNPIFQKFIPYCNYVSGIIETATKDILGAGMSISNDNHLIASLIKTDSNGNLIWSRQYKNVIASNYVDVLSLLAANDGGYIVVGTCMMQDSGIYRTGNFIMKVDSMGIYQWSKGFYNLQSVEIVLDAMSTKDGNIILSGVSNNSYSFIMKLTESGQIIWSKKLPSAYLLNGNNVSEFKRGDYLYSFLNNGGGMYLFLDSLGNLKEAHCDKLQGTLPSKVFLYNNKYYFLSAKAVSSSKTGIIFTKSLQYFDFCRDSIVNTSMLPNEEITTDVFFTATDTSGIISTSIPQISYSMTDSTICYPSDIEELPMPSSLTVAPNPSSGIYNFISTSLIDRLEVFDLVGNVVYRTKCQQKKIQLNLEHLSPGIYLYKVLQQGLVLNGKLEKE